MPGGPPITSLPLPLPQDMVDSIIAKDLIVAGRREQPAPTQSPVPPGKHLDDPAGCRRPDPPRTTSFCLTGHSSYRAQRHPRSHQFLTIPPNPIWTNSDLIGRPHVDADPSSRRWPRRSRDLTITRERPGRRSHLRSRSWSSPRTPAQSGRASGRSRCSESGCTLTPLARASCATSHPNLACRRT